MIEENQRSFGRTLKEKAKQEVQLRCELCTVKLSPHELQLHHKYVWVCEAKRYNIPGKFVACRENAQVLCSHCHTKIHRRSQERPPHQLIEGLLFIARMKGDSQGVSGIIESITRSTRS